MKYHKIILLNNGMECCLRNGTTSDGAAVLENFNLTHAQTDYLLSYPEENTFDAVQEGKFLEEKAESENEIEIIAAVGGEVVGTAGMEAVERNTRYVIARSSVSALRKSFGDSESDGH